MPFAQVIEPRVVLAGAPEKLVQKRFVVRGVAHEMRDGAAALLERDVNNTERVCADVLADNDTANLTQASAELALEALDYSEGQQQLHRHAP